MGHGEGVGGQGSGAGGFDTTIIYVQGYQLAPFYDWSYGCSPTAATMEVGYLDEAQGYSRDIYDFFHRWDGVEGENDWQIPWAHREMALAFNTDSLSGGTWVTAIGPGLADFGSSKDYSFEIFQFPGGWYNDWAWPSDSDEISNGWSMVWSVGWPGDPDVSFAYGPGHQAGDERHLRPQHVVDAGRVVALH